MRFVLPLYLLIVVPATAHVGSSDVFCEGDAGPYHFFVTIRVPQVIPGVAEIEIRTQSNDVSEVRIVLLRLTGAGAKYAPTPDVAQRSQDDPQFFTGSLWLMEFGSLQVRIQADGAQGKGELSVPVPAVAQRTLRMRRPLAALLLGLMVLLAIGVVSIAAAGAREAELEPGGVLSPAHRRRSRVVMAVSSVLVLAFLYVGKQWWNAEAAAYAANVYKNPRVSAALESSNRLLLSARDAKEQSWRESGTGWVSPGYLDDLIPDHNHLMHLFLIRLPAMDRFLHLHPDKTGSEHFVAELPPMAAGRYQIFADVVHQSGFPVTLVGDVDVPNVPGKALGGDDCGWSGSPLSTPAKQSTVSALSDDGRMVWERSSTALKAGVATSFRFRVEDYDGKPAQDMEPYMGMAGHAEFVRSDLKVFAHVHPAGSVSMAALELAQTGLLANPADAQARMQASMAMPTARPLPPEVSFPYGFPQPGDYRIFVQVKRAGRIETGVFDAHVM